VTAEARSATAQSTDMPPGAPAIEITLLTQPDCAFCEHTKAVLARLSGEFPLAVTEIDLTSLEGQGLAVEHGMLFAPGLLMDGRAFGYGRISERRLRRALAAHTAHR
jgi:glutaredoxin